MGNNMSKTKIYDSESSEYVGEIEIPDDVKESAARVSAWLEAQGDKCIGNQLGIADNIVPRIMVFWVTVNYAPYLVGYHI